MKFTTIANTKRDTNLSYLGNINKSAKLAKNGKISHQYTYSIYLAPSSLSGYNVCSHSTPECRLNCLHTSGRNSMEIISGVKTMTNDCRIKKTRLFYEYPEYFMQWLIAELERYQNKAKKDGYGFSVRLNCTSDINWQTVLIDGKNLFELYPDVVFYDYSKNPAKFINKPENYHLTFSFTGRNVTSCIALLKQGYSVAVVFDIKNETELPKTFMGFPVINGDKTDARFLDPKGVIVGLKFKRIANQKAEKGCFVVNPKTDIRCQNINVHENELAVV
jgi:hypothetical protein